MRRILTLAIIISILYGCGAAHTMIKKRNLDVQTKMSDTIFLEPVKPSDKVVFVSVRNTTDKKLTIKQEIINDLQNNGYTITKDPDQAKFMLQANILKLGKSDQRTSNAYLSGGYGAVIGGAIGAVSSNPYNSGSTLLGALAGSAISMVGDALVEDTFYTMVTDLQLRERPRKGERIKQRQDTMAKQGHSTGTYQMVTAGQIDWKTYRTRIVSTANQFNLKFDGARPELEKGLIRSISGLLSEE